MQALVVDDEPDLVRVVRGYLEREGFSVRAAGDGESALELARVAEPDVVVLDLGLPGIDGVETCRRLRIFTDCYVVMLTARADEVDMLIGLAVGADDYVTKPFSPRELTARIRTLLRRPRGRQASVAAADSAMPRGPEPALRVVGDLVVDPEAREVSVAGQPVALTRTEFDLVEALSSRPRAVFSRRQLIDRVWGADWFGDEHLVDIHLGHVRRKLGDDPGASRYVVTVRGVGYRLGSG
jgi:DNA-binding response OmpR family regulator